MTATPPASHPGAPTAGARPRAAPVTLVDVPELLAGTLPRGRPLLVHHWASWDELSTAGLPALVALVRDSGIDAVGIAWDEFADPPLGRIAPMAQRPARWAGGAQAEAWVRQAGIGWPILVFGAGPDALFEALGIVDRWVPQVTVYRTDGTVGAHHGGPLAGEGWDAFVSAVGRELGGGPPDQNV